MTIADMANPAAAREHRTLPRTSCPTSAHSSAVRNATPRRAAILRHSMAAIALGCALKYQDAQALVLSAPALAVADEPSLLGC
jgi:hypothetical protein